MHYSIIYTLYHLRADHSATLVLMWMGITLWKKKLEKELLKGIKHSMQTKRFLKVIRCPGNSNWSYIGQYLDQL